MNSAVQLPKDRKHVVYQDLVALLTLASQAASTGSEDVDSLKILLCIQGSKKTQGSKLGPADESRASLAHVLFLAHTQDHPSKDLSGQTNQ